MKSLILFASIMFVSFLPSSCERNEHNPEIPDQEFHVDENSKEGTIVGILEAFDQDGNQQISFGITAGNTNDAFAIDSNTGAIRVNDSTQLDFETTPEFKLAVLVCDNYKDSPLESSALVIIYLNDVDEISITLKDFTGYVQKGPFINGSSVTIYEIDEELEQTGRVFNTQISDNQGSFSLPGVELHSQYVHLKSDGFYFNEVSGELSEAQLTLYSIVDVKDVESTNINILSHLESGRLRFLFEEGLTFAEAKKQAREEVMQVFNISGDGLPNSNDMNISKAGEDNAKLLAISIILQGGNSTGELAELVNNFSLDFASDGRMDSESIGTTLINGVNHANLTDIRRHLESRYDELGIVYEIPPFEKYVNQFIETSSFIATNHIKYPESGSYGENFLNLDVKVVENDIKGSFAIEVPEGRSLKFKVIHNTLWISTFSGINMTWTSFVTEGDRGYNTFETSSSGLCDVEVFFNMREGDSNIIDIEYYEDGSSEPSYSKTMQIDGGVVPIDSTLMR